MMSTLSLDSLSYDTMNIVIDHLDIITTIHLASTNTRLHDHKAVASRIRLEKERVEKTVDEFQEFLASGRKKRVGHWTTLCDTTIYQWVGRKIDGDWLGFSFNVEIHKHAIIFSHTHHQKLKAFQRRVIKEINKRLNKTKAYLYPMVSK